MSSSLINSSKGKSGTFGLKEKSPTSVKGEGKLIHAKLAVTTEFYDRWSKVMERLNVRYAGGTNAILLNAIEELLPQLEVMAKDIPEPDAKGGAL